MRKSFRPATLSKSMISASDSSRVLKVDIPLESLRRDCAGHRFSGESGPDQVTQADPFLSRGSGSRPSSLLSYRASGGSCNSWPPPIARTRPGRRFSGGLTDVKIVAVGSLALGPCVDSRLSSGPRPVSFLIVTAIESLKRTRGLCFEPTLASHEGLLASLDRGGFRRACRAALLQGADRP